MTDTAATPAAVIAALIANLGEGLAPVLESVTGYRAQCEAAGFSPTVAEAMAAAYHNHLMAMMFDMIAEVRHNEAHKQSNRKARR